MTRDRERRREDERYWGDVVYEVWRAGGNSDAVDRDWTRDRQDDGLDADEAAKQFLRARDRHPEPGCEFSEPEALMPTPPGVSVKG